MIPELRTAEATRWYASPAGRVWGRVAGGLTAACAGSHVGMAVSALASGSLSLAMALLGLAAACLPCALGLWTGPDATGWWMTAAMAATMLALHTPLMLFSVPTGQMAHQHAPGAWSGWAEAGVALIVLQLAVTGAVVLTHWLRRWLSALRIHA